MSRSLLLIGSLQLLLLATAAAALAARLLASQRDGETAMLSARGAARGQLLLASLAEAVLLAVTGALAGIVAGSYLTDRLMSANRLPVGHPARGLSGVVRGVTAGGAWWPAVVIVAGADGRDHDLAAVLDAAGGARYPLRLLGLTVRYPLPGFPAPPYPSAAARRAAARAEQRHAAARVTLAVRGLAVSPRTSGGFPAPFAGADALLRWHAAASATGLADPRAPGIAPAVTSWRASGGRPR